MTHYSITTVTTPDLEGSLCDFFVFTQNKEAGPPDPSLRSATKPLLKKSIQFTAPPPTFSAQPSNSPVPSATQANDPSI